MAPTRIILARHGVTDFTVEGRWDGRGGADPALNDLGLTQAAALAERAQRLLGDEKVRVISSTLARAKMTAAPVGAAFGVAVEAREAWDELAFGEWDGLRGDDIAAAHPSDFLRFLVDETFRLPGGESHIDMHQRVRPAFEALLDNNQTTIVVAHLGPIMSVLSLILGLDLSAARRLLLRPTAMSGIVLTPTGPNVEFVNDLAALQFG